MIQPRPLRCPFRPFRPFRPSLVHLLAAAVLIGAVLAGAPVPGVQPPPAGAAPVPKNSVSAFGAAADHGPANGMDLNAPLVGGAAPADGGGYWLVASDGGVFAFGDVGYHGSAGGIDLNEPIVAMAATPSGDGYWLVASDGGVFAFGDAGFHGSMGGVALNRPVVGIAAHPSGDGYWLVASDGGVFSFGAARFHGSAGDLNLDAPVVSMAATLTGNGYWLAAGDAGVFTYGDAEFHGAMGDKDLPSPIEGIARDYDGHGYWLAARNGQVHPFGPKDHGNATTEDPDETQPPTVAIVPHPDGGYWLVHGERRTIAPQEEGPHVEALQRRLHERGYWVGPIDGVYGELTKQAVYAFEKYEGLPVDGVADTETRQRLARAGRPVPRSGSGDLIEVDKTRQLLFIVRNGGVLWAFNTSTGTEEPYTYEGRQYQADTPPGRWEIYRQVDGVRESNLGRLYRPKYFHTDGIAVHGYSFVPPYPASHGCVRVTRSAIDYIWAHDLAPIGADVWVYGTTPQ